MTNSDDTSYRKRGVENMCRFINASLVCLVVVTFFVTYDVMNQINLVIK